MIWGTVLISPLFRLPVYKAGVGVCFMYPVVERLSLPRTTWLPFVAPSSSVHPGKAHFLLGPCGTAWRSQAVSIPRHHVLFSSLHRTWA